jgi:hypothetical protein
VPDADGAAVPLEDIASLIGDLAKFRGVRPAEPRLDAPPLPWAEKELFATALASGRRSSK